MVRRLATNQPHCIIPRGTTDKVPKQGEAPLPKDGTDRGPLNPFMQEGVRKMVLPAYAQDPSKTPPVKGIKPIRVLPGQGPGLRSIQKDGKNTGRIETELGPFTDPAVIPDRIQ